MTTITVAYGDGIGPEIMEATLSILKEAGAMLNIETVELGERIYNMGGISGILPSAWEGLRRNKVLLKAPTIIPEIEHYTFKDVNTALFEKFAREDEETSQTEIIFEIPESAGAFTGRALITPDFALFEPTHDSQQELTGKNTTNPSGMILAAILMLKHIGQEDIGTKIHNAWLRTMQDGLHTADMYVKKTSKKKLKTSEFAGAVVERLGQKP